MLTSDDNNLMCRISNGTVGGSMIREYWMPVFLSSELSETDGIPVRTTLLGESLVGFRDTNGRVGLIQSNCPHRGAPLYFGRNEERGIRCVYHGWKFDVDGNCVDMPNESGESIFKEKVRAQTYPCEERNGIVWTYMGALNEPPPLPDLEWNLVPVEQVYVTKRVMDCNFVQALEGEIDSSHSAFLHSNVGAHSFSTPLPDVSATRRPFEFHVGGNGGLTDGEYFRMKDKQPKFDVQDSSNGVLIGAGYRANEDSLYWRITQFLMPFHTIIPPYGADPTYSGHAWVPMDDEHTMSYCFTYHPTRPLSSDHVELLRFGKDGMEGLHPTQNVLPGPPRIPGDDRWQLTINAGNDYLIDWDRQRTDRFSGLPGVWPQDTALQEGMGPIYDRRQEHLGTTDKGIIRVRQCIIRAAKGYENDDLIPPGSQAATSYMVRSAGAILPETDPDWLSATAGARKAILGSNTDSP
jgi:phthalate 4,5-dioxygenase oxygenase subunit